MTHPGKIEDGRVLWFGPEVEGQLGRAHLRPMTAFIADRLADADVQRVLSIAQHIFLTETFGEWSWFEHSLYRALPDWMPVTVAREGTDDAIKAVLALPYASRLRIVARVWGVEWVHLLRHKDEVSLGVHYHLVTLPMSEAVWTAPDAYKDDEP